MPLRAAPSPCGLRLARGGRASNAFRIDSRPLLSLAIVAMYAGVQFVEDNFITAVIQSEVTSLPPAVSLLSVIACAMLLDPSAAFLAVPLALFAVTIIDVLYAKEAPHGILAAGDTSGVAH